MASLKTVKIVGPAGTGIKSTGLLLSKLLLASGFNIKDYSEYPSLIRGGHNTYQVSFSPGKIFSVHSKIDLLLNLETDHWQPHLSEMSPGSILITQDAVKSDMVKVKLLTLPLKEIAVSHGSRLYSNTVGLGAIACLYGLNYKLVLSLLKNHFGNSSPNITAFNSGYSYISKNYPHFIHNLTGKKSLSGQAIYDGNESFSWGFIKGGGDFFAAYPMTPATGALHFLAQKQQDYNLKVFHPEDEIAAASMATGAAFAGARAAVATSGGGYALMNETVSFNGVAEIPMVYYLVSRPGPATGMPTWTSQGDLLYTVFSGHGEFPKIVIAPGDQQETFDFSVKALNLAQQLQTPVFVLSDKMISESSCNLTDLSLKTKNIKTGKLLANPKTGFRRYAYTQSGVSPMTIPGTAEGEFLSNSYEHDQYGFATEDSAVSEKMNQKRLKKLKTALSLTPKANFFGHKNAKKLIISWGSTKGAILEALKIIKNDNFAYLQLCTLWPIDQNLQYLINSFKDITLVENNATAQLQTLLKSQFDFRPTRRILRSDGRPFFPEELVKYFQKI